MLTMIKITGFILKQIQNTQLLLIFKPVFIPVFPFLTSFTSICKASPRNFEGNI